MLVRNASLPPMFVPQMADAGRRLTGRGEPGLLAERYMPQFRTVPAAIAACDGVIDLMAAVFSIDSRALRSPSRSATDIARVRQIGMYVAHVTLGMRMGDVATGFSRRKSTVVHACHLIEDMREDREFDRVVAKVEEIVRIAFSLAVPGVVHER